MRIKNYLDPIFFLLFCPMGKKKFKTDKKSQVHIYGKAVIKHTAMGLPCCPEWSRVAVSMVMGFCRMSPDWLTVLCIFHHTVSRR